jgi:lipoate-protein ligase A
VVAFGRQDVRSPGYARAVAAAREAGFTAVERLAGGRAAVFHEDTIAFAWTRPDPSPASRTTARFQEISGLLCAAFRRLGVDARVGEVSGEYCPGAYSVNARGTRKLMGVGQRLAPRAAHVGGVIVVDRSDRVRSALVPVYDRLGLSWTPDTAGSIAEEVGGARYDDVLAAVIDEFASRYELEDTEFDGETVALAQKLSADHRSP